MRELHSVPDSPGLEAGAVMLVTREYGVRLGRLGPEMTGTEPNIEL